MCPDSDGRLLELAGQGDRSALHELVLRHRRRIERLALVIVGRPEAACDIAQEAFVRMLQALDKLDPERGLKAWLDRVVVNLAVDHLRRRKRRAHLSLPILTEPVQPERDDKSDRQALRERVYAALDRMPTKYRTVLVLRDLEGCQVGEIAELLRRRPGTVRWRLSVARRMFRRLWKAASD